MKRFSCVCQSQSLSAICAPNQRRSPGDDACVLVVMCWLIEWLIGV